MRSRLLFFALASVFLAGCGGGGGSTAPTDPGGSVPTGPVSEFGPIETRGQVNGTPIVRDLGKISTVALAGVLTDATYRPQGVPDNETAIAVGNAKEIDVVLETGEQVDTWKPGLPSGSQYYLLPHWSPDGQKLYFLNTTGIYFTTPADPTTATLVISGNGIGRWALSPDGTKIMYTRTPTGEADQEVYERAVAGGATKRLTTNDLFDLSGCWLDNDRVVIYTDNADHALAGSHIVNVSTLASTNYTPFLYNLVPVGISDSGRYVFNNIAALDATKGVSITDTDSDPQLFSSDYLDGSTLNGTILEANTSPDGKRWAVAFPDRIFTTELIPQTQHLVVPQTPGFYYGSSWQPALGITKFVGTGGKIGSTSAGIIATNRSGANADGSKRKGLASFVNWDATTRTTSTVSDDATDSSAGSKSYTIEADKITALRYANRPLFAGVATVSASGNTNGAVVTLDASDGTVASVVVYTETRGAKPTIRREGDRKVLEGRFEGVWNAKGQNVAPGGATRVTLDGKGNPTVG